MAWKVGGGARILLSGLSILENEAFERSCGITLVTCAFQNWSCEPSSSGRTSKIGLNPAPCLQNRYILSSVNISTSPKKATCRPCTVFRHLPLFLMRRHDWRITFALDTGGIPGNDGQESINEGDSNGLGGTRLGRIVSAGGRQLLEKLNSARKNFPMKIFLLLLGFYTANALATILGQTGDWDVLVAGVVVAAIEGIGMLTYRKPPSISKGRLQSFVAMVNYWKAGVCLGLFVDAFKLGS